VCCLLMPRLKNGYKGNSVAAQRKRNARHAASQRLCRAKQHSEPSEGIISEGAHHSPTPPIHNAPTARLRATGRPWNAPHDAEEADCNGFAYWAKRQKSTEQELAGPVTLQTNVNTAAQGLLVMETGPGLSVVAPTTAQAAIAPSDLSHLRQHATATGTTEASVQHHLLVKTAPYDHVEITQRRIGVPTMRPSIRVTRIATARSSTPMPSALAAAAKKCGATSGRQHAHFF